MPSIKGSFDSEPIIFLPFFSPLILFIQQSSTKSKASSRDQPLIEFLIQHNPFLGVGSPPDTSTTLTCFEKESLCFLFLCTSTCAIQQKHSQSHCASFLLTQADACAHWASLYVADMTSRTS